MNKILIIQTAFIGDAILATAVLEKLHEQYPEAEIDILVKRGNENLFSNHPYLHKVLVLDKKAGKFSSITKKIKEIRARKYGLVVNLHRFFSSGLITVLSGAKQTVGFDKNPLSIFFSEKKQHDIRNGVHEIERNHQLIAALTGSNCGQVKLYPAGKDDAATLQYKNEPYVCIAPASVWFTKQFPAEKWLELLKRLTNYPVYLLGAANDTELCERIIKAAEHNKIDNLAGKLNFLESASLMRDAAMNYVNDSAPMHIASAVNAPVTAVFCSTVPEFGFGPLSEKSKIVQIREKLPCRPCGLHGKPTCPKGHFKCALAIDINELVF